MKKILTTSILISLCMQQFILPMNIASAAPVEQKSFLSLIGKEANYKNLFDKVLAFDMTSQMHSRKEGDNSYSPTIRSSEKSIGINSIDQVIKTSTMDINGIPVDFDYTGTVNLMNTPNVRRILASRHYYFRESPSTPGVIESQKSDESDTITIG